MLVDLLMEVRRRKRPLDSLPDPLKPATVVEAYAVQDELIARKGGLAGWKVGPSRSPGAEPRCAPVLLGDLKDTTICFGPNDFVTSPELEVEIAIRFARDILPGPSPIGVDEVEIAIGSVHCALEILSSRFNGRHYLDPFVSLADCQSSGAVVLGEGIEDWRSLEFAETAFEISFDGCDTVRKEGGPTTMDVLNTLTWLANHAAVRKHGLRAGQVVITGARTNAVHMPKHAKLVTGTAFGVGTVCAKFA